MNPFRGKKKEGSKDSVKYCISDIHGESERYFQMLEKINFSSDDQLYIIGDVIDRGPGGIEILRDIIPRENVVLLLGNHELMCRQALQKNRSPEAMSTWMQNGGGVTYRELFFYMTREERMQILQYIAQCPAALEVKVGKRKFFLVHGFPAKGEERCVWKRPSKDTPNPLKGRYTLVIGHTPVWSLEDDEVEYIEGIRYNDDHVKIAHCRGFIDIDCGCGHALDLRRLACLRLDDMREFYV